MSGPRVFDRPADLFGSESTSFGPTEWLAIEQERVNGFAEVTGDDQWIHVDVERAKTGPFGGTIAHGYLTLSLVNYFLPRLLQVRRVAHAVNVGADRLRFLAPVPVGNRIRAMGEVLKVEKIRGAIQATVRVTVEIEGGDKPACTIDTISRFYPDEDIT